MSFLNGFPPTAVALIRDAQALQSAAETAPPLRGPGTYRFSGFCTTCLACRQYYSNRLTQQRISLINPGHGAGPASGFWVKEEADPRGAGLINASIAWSIELTSDSAVSEWSGQAVNCHTEEDAVFDGPLMELTLIAPAE